MDDTQDSFDKVNTVIEETIKGAEQRIKDRRQQDKSQREEQKKSKKTWSKDDYALLAKAVNKFPGGTQDRWKTIASFMGDRFTSKEVIEMAKMLATKGKNAVKSSQEKIIKSKADKQEDKEQSKTNDDGPVWTDKEQKLLEDALRKFPKTLAAKERWTKISGAVPGKTPKECLTRFKYIASMLKKK